MDEFWKTKIDLLKTKIEDKDISYIFDIGIRDLAFFYRTYFDDNVLKNIVDNMITLLIQTNNSLLQLALIYLASEINFIQITETEEFYKEKIRIILTELISKINKVKTNVDKDYPQEYRLFSSIPKAVSLYIAGNYKTMEATLLELQKSFSDNPRINLLLALSKIKTSSTIYRVNLIEVIKISTNNIEKAIAQELVGDISELLQSISWYEDSENIYLEFGLYRDLLRLYSKKIEKLKTDPTKKNQIAQEYLKLSNILLKLNDKNQAKKYLFEGFNILLQLNSFIEIIETIKKNNLIEVFPENKQEILDIIIKTFEKRINIDPYNINLYLEYAKWLSTFKETEKQLTILKTAYKISTERRLNDKLLLISQNLIQIDPINIENISIYIESMIINKVNEQEISDFLLQKLQELQKNGKINDYNYLIQKFSNILPLDSIKNMEKQKIMELINKTTNIQEKIKIIQDYLSKYPDDYEINHLYIILKSSININDEELYSLILKSIDWYKSNIKNLKPNEIEIIYNILIEKRDFDNLQKII